MDLVHILDAAQFREPALLQEIYSTAAKYESQVLSGQVDEVLKGKIISTLFFEPSTRTRLSFEAAAFRLGARVISCENAIANSSSFKGETVEDSIMTICGYADCVIMRHPQNGAAAAGSKVSSIPLINAGDGSGEHPTQALLDMFTIYKKFGSPVDLKIGLAGDLKNGRTVHSLIQLLSIYEGVKLYLFCPNDLSLDQKYLEMLSESGISYVQTEDWSEYLADLDILYMTRVQKERFSDYQEYERLKDAFILNEDALAKLSSRAIILHPLPRVNEIAVEVDADPRAMYFQQARNGLYVRMALLDLALNHPEKLSSSNYNLDSSGRGMTLAKKFSELTA
ncbi:MAG: aspartate carbamoyltransferase [Patescibacteria group bacterium]